MIAELLWFLIGTITGYGFSTKERRKAILTKLNDLTKPKDTTKEPPKP